jgi:hypothetical protein
VNTDGDSRQAKKQPVEQQEVAGSECKRAVEARESGLCERASTQGHRKAWQRIQDLWQNEEFLAELAAIQAIPDSRKQSRRLWKFAEDNGLDLFTGSPLFRLLGNEKPFPQDANLDFCGIVDEPDDIFNDTLQDLWAAKPRPLRDHRHFIMLFPIRICISPMASKRDVLDYVTKKWDEIRSSLDKYSDREKPPVIRKKPKAARNQFIWENREVPSQKLAEMVNGKFPGESLVYYQVDSIKHYMKKRNS